MTDREFWTTAWAKNRAEWIARYRESGFSRERRRDCRFWALHYGRLVRRMRAAP